MVAPWSAHWHKLSAPAVLNLLVFLLIFVLPINLFLSFPTGFEYQNGLRIDYLIPKLYLSEFIGLAVIVVSAYLITHKGLADRNWQVTRSLRLLIVLVALFISEFFSPLPLIGVLSFTKVLLAVVLMVLLGRVSGLLTRKMVVVSMTFSLLWQFFLTSYQWINQSSLLPYVISGEPRLEWSLFMAKSTLLQPGVILPYGSTAHPNVLAGFAAIYGLGLLAYCYTQWQKRHQMHPLLLGSVVVGLFCSLSIQALTESFSALLTFFGGSLLLGLTAYFTQKTKQKKVPRFTLPRIQWYLLAAGLLVLLTLVVQIASSKQPTNPSFWRRALLLDATRQMLVKQPLMGVGGGQFTVALGESPLVRQLAPFIQPVHAAPVLFLVEYGLLGALALILAARRFPEGWFAKRLPVFFLAIIPLLAFDHYLVSLAPGLLLLAITPMLWRKSRTTNRIGNNNT